MKRRSFLGALGAALAVGPETVAKQSGLSLDVFGASGLMPQPSLLSIGAIAASGAGAWEKKKLFQINILKTLNPEWFKAQRRENAKHVGQLDVSIAALRSVSVAGKISMQRERNYQTQMANEEKWLNFRLQERLFEDANP